MNIAARFSILLWISFCSIQSFAVDDGSSIPLDFSLALKQQIATTDKIQVLLPVPNNIITIDANIQISINGKTPITAQFFVVNTWPKIPKGTKGNNDASKPSAITHYVRLLLIELDKQFVSLSALTLSWHNSKKAKLSKISNLNQVEVSLIYPSQNWLAQSLLLHPEYSQKEHQWYVEPQKKYAEYFTNQALLTQNGYPPEKAAQWLYDRPQAIYQLFIMTGDKKWLTAANELSTFYQQHLDEEGQFTLKNRFDAKYLMPKGLLYDYFLSGSYQAKYALEKIFKASLEWDEEYSSRRGFWTERNQAAALNTAVSYWEVSHDEMALTRINNIIDATVEMTFSPKNDWQLVGCPQHSFKSHEGWGDNSPACSPWMMALLGDALWRFYQLTGDKRAAALIDAFGDFILNYGLFYGDKRVKNIVIPKYIVSIENPEQEELNQWTNPQHACDAAALLGKSAYIKAQSGSDNFMVKTLFSALLEQCQQRYVQLKKEKNKKPYWLLKPARRFAWVYSSTSDLPWLNSQLNTAY